ncbi:MAG: hypothetical protein OQK29_06355 [Ignavibacteriaceae bacterium]|nr:hypothetical protein [Ignavibacteriaceae bacterium]
MKLIMRGKSFFASILLVLGLLFILLFLISAYFFLISFIERQSYGPGLLFADVELFAFAVIIFGIFGSISIYFSRKIFRSNQ